MLFLGLKLPLELGGGVLNNNIYFGKIVSQLLETDTLKILWLLKLLFKIKYDMQKLGSFWLRQATETSKWQMESYM